MMSENWSTLVYFSCVDDAMTSEKSDNPACGYFVTYVGYKAIRSATADIGHSQ